MDIIQKLKYYQYDIQMGDYEQYQDFRIIK